MFNVYILGLFLLRISNLISSGQRLYFTYFQSFKFFENCFMAQQVLCPGRCFVCTCKECAFCRLWLKCSINVGKSKFFDSVIPVYYVLTDFFLVFYLFFVSKPMKSLLLNYLFLFSVLSVFASSI